MTVARNLKYNVHQVIGDDDLMPSPDYSYLFCDVL